MSVPSGRGVSHGLAICSRLLPRPVEIVGPSHLGGFLWEEFEREPGSKTRVHVANVLAHDDAATHAHCDRVHRLPQEHVSVDVQHIVHVLRLG